MKCDLWRIKLRKWGYHVTDSLVDGGHHGGLTKRKRYYCVASIYPDFCFPDPLPQKSKALWPLIEQHLGDCRDVTETSSVQKGNATGRIRLITPETISSPALLKAQFRQAKDSVYIKHHDRFYFPSIALMQVLSGIPDDFNTSCVSQTIRSEIIGRGSNMPCTIACCSQSTSTCQTIAASV